MTRKAQFRTLFICDQFLYIDRFHCHAIKLPFIEWGQQNGILQEINNLFVRSTVKPYWYRRGREVMTDARNLGAGEKGIMHGKALGGGVNRICNKVGHTRR